MTLARLARWCYQRRWRVLLAWIVLLVAMNVLSSAIGNAYKIVPHVGPGSAAPVRGAVPAAAYPGTR